MNSAVLASSTLPRLQTTPLLPTDRKPRARPLTPSPRSWRPLLVWRQHHAEELWRLHWAMPGTVWGMHFTEAPAPVDGMYPYLLAARDLGRFCSWSMRRLPTTNPNAKRLQRSENLA